MTTTDFSRRYVGRWLYRDRALRLLRLEESRQRVLVGDGRQRWYCSVRQLERLIARRLLRYAGRLR